MDFVWVGFGAFFVVSLAVGVRLVTLAAHTRQAPELLIGLGVLGIGPVGFGLQTLAGLVSGYELAETLAIAGACATAIGIWAKLTFNWLVYRRESRAALNATGILAIAVAAQLLAQPMLGSFVEAGENIPLTAARGALQSIALAWGSAEAFAYWGRLRKRARLGLADPVLVNRFLMWAISAAAAGLGTAIGVTASVVSGAGPLQLPSIVASSSAHGFVAAVGMWLAFAPPRAYVAWLSSGRAAA
jgi:hypothetical protein